MCESDVCREIGLTTATQRNRKERLKRVCREETICSSSEVLLEIVSCNVWLSHHKTSNCMKQGISILTGIVLLWIILQRTWDIELYMRDESNHPD